MPAAGSGISKPEGRTSIPAGKDALTHHQSHPTRAFYGRCTTHKQIQFTSNVIPRTYCGNMPAGIGWANIGKHRLLTANPLWRTKPTGQKKPTPERIAEWAYTQQVSHGTHWVLILLAFGVIVILATGIYNHTIITNNLIRAGVGQLCRADFFLYLRCGHG